MLNAGKSVQVASLSVGRDIGDFWEVVTQAEERRAVIDNSMENAQNHFSTRSHHPMSHLKILFPDASNKESLCGERTGGGGLLGCTWG